jgi:Carboxypeptidase regulatory-like domain
MRMPKALKIVGILFLAGQISAVQRLGPGYVEGIVVRLGTADPLSDVDVELARVEGTSAYPLRPLTYPPGDMGPGLILRPTYPNPADLLRTRTRADGRFSFANLPPGKYRLLAARAGGMYYPAEFGQHHPRGRGYNFQLVADQAMRDIKLEMALTGSISGKILGADGTPAARVQVMLYEASYLSGRRLLGLMQSAVTDDRGEYRLFYLPPGRYYIGARFEDPRVRSTSFRRYGQEPGTELLSRAPVIMRTTESGEVIEETVVTVYYGGDTDPGSARPITVSSGSAVNSIDILLTAGQPRAFHVRGTVVNSNGLPVPATVRVIPRTWSPSMIAPVMNSDANGNFDIAGVPAGAYYLRANRGEGQVVLAAFSPLEVTNGNAEGIRLVLSAGATTSGTIVLEGRTASGQLPDISALRVSLAPDHPMIGSGTAGPLNGNSFTVTSIQPGDYRVSVSPVQRGISGPPYTPPAPVPAAFQDFYVKSVRMGGADILEPGLHLQGQPPGEIEVVIGVNGGSVQGVAVDRRQQPVPNAVVALTPAPTLRRRTDLYKSTITDSNGRFRLPGIAPGDYRLFSWEYIEDGIWFDAEFMSSIETRGRSIRISEGTTESVELPVLAEP